MIIKNCQQGFTLLELTAIISILGFVIILCMPNFRYTLQNYQLSVAAQEVGENLRLAQKFAITEGVSYRVLFDLNDRTIYRITAGIKAKKYQLPAGVNFDWTNFSNYTLTFYPSGAPVQGGTVALKNNNTKIYVIVSVATGRVRIGKTPP